MRVALSFLLMQLCCSCVFPKKSFHDVEIPARIKGRYEQIICHSGYSVSYNADWRISNWVAYELTPEEVAGTVSRKDKYIPDPKVNGATATNDDYKGSGWDRGHMAPAADMKWSRRAMEESSYLSNICPQNHNLNGGVWKDIEEKTRSMVVKKGSMYVVCGPIVSKRSQTIGSNKVVVPDAFFKALLQKNNQRWEAIAFICPNESGRKKLSSYAMTIDDLEKITGIDFFHSLPDEIENDVESRFDLTYWKLK
jgi:endonuclease G